MILSVISGTYNRVAYLKAMVESARKSMPPGLEHEFVITDGGSTDASLEWMRSQSDIRIIEHGELKGAIKAFNDAGEAAKGDYLLIANDDVEFNGFSIAKALAFAMDHAEVGAVCFFQDRGGKAMHVERMPVKHADGKEDWLPYMQVGLIPRWLWNKCGGWGDWGGRTYGGDNYISAKVYESGYKVVPLDGCSIKDKTPIDELRRINNAGNQDGKKLWASFPGGIQVSPFPIYENPLQPPKRILYAPIIEHGHHVQKEQKCGLREALKALGLVWEVDYDFGGESIADAADAWQPHYTITQIHTADAVPLDTIKKLREATKEWMVCWNGDVWQHTQSDPRYLEMLRLFDYHLCVNKALDPIFAAKGIRAEYWQNSAEPSVFDNDEAGPRHDVLFLGNNYSDYRTHLATVLKEMPFDVAVYGRGYTTADGAPLLVNGQELSSGESLYDYRKTGQLYRGARIAIADNQYPDATGFCSDRAFMILAAGNCLMMHQRVDKMEELLGLKDGVHYIAWTDFDDLKTKIEYYLAHEEERRAIANAGTLECRTKHTYAARVEELKALVAKLPKKDRKKTISACMIVKNEAPRMGNVLLQLERFADEIVVVDTGSTDGTLELLRNTVSQKLKVYEFQWCEDFAAARNFAKGKATMEWVFWMDADEVLDEVLLNKLCGFTDWNFTRLGLHNPQAFRFLCMAMIDGKPRQTVLQCRLFKNLESITWEGRVHESVDDSLRNLGIEPVPYKGMRVIHMGVSDPEVVARKQEHYIQILKEDFRGAFTFYFIGISYMAMKRWGDAYVWFDKTNRSVENKEFKSFLHFAMGHSLAMMGLIGEAKELLRKSEFIDAYFLLAELEQKNGEFRADLYRKFLDARLPDGLPSFAILWRPKARERLMLWHAEEMEELKEMA